MLVREAMTRTVITVTPRTTLRRAAALLSEHSITSLPVVDPAGRLIGLVGEADVVRGSLVPDQRTHMVQLSLDVPAPADEVQQVMTRMPLTVRPDTDLADAVRIMTDSKVKSLPVTDRGKVVGVISRADVVRELAHHDQRIAADLDELVRSDSYDWMVEVVDGVVTFEGVDTEDERSLARALAGSVGGVRGIQFRDARARRRS